MRTEQFRKALSQLSKQGKGFKPHKHLALMAVLRLVQRGELRTPVVRFDEAFKAAFGELIAEHGGESDRDRPHTDNYASA